MVFAYITARLVLFATAWAAHVAHGEPAQSRQSALDAARAAVRVDHHPPRCSVRAGARSARHSARTRSTRCRRVGRRLARWALSADLACPARRARPFSELTGQCRCRRGGCTSTARPVSDRARNTHDQANTMIVPTPDPDPDGQGVGGRQRGCGRGGGAVGGLRLGVATSDGIGFDQRADLGARRGGEAVVQQVRGLLPRRDRLPGAAHQHRDQPAAVVVGGADERLARRRRCSRSCRPCAPG